MNRLRGFTLVEVLVVISITSLLGLIIGSYVTSSMKLSRQDIGNMNATQNAQGSLDIILNDIRNAGENLDTTIGISGLEISNADKQIIVRRNITVADRTLITRLPVCGFSGNRLLVSGTPLPPFTGTSAACTYSDGDSNNDDDTVQRWRSVFAAQPNVAQVAILYTPPTSTTGAIVSKVVVTQVDVREGMGTNSSPYRTYITLKEVPSNSSLFTTAASSQIILLEERRYKVIGDELKLMLGGQTDEQGQTVAFNVTDMTLSAALSATLSSPAQTVNSINLTGPWTRIQKVNVSLSAKASNDRRLRSSQAKFSGEMFPRNVASSKSNLQ